MQTLSQSTAMLDPAAQAKKIRDREITKSKKPSTLKKVRNEVVISAPIKKTIKIAPTICC